MKKKKNYLNLNNKWTLADLVWLEENKHLPAKEQAAHLGRTVMAVWAKKSRTGLSKPTDCARKWTRKEINALRAMAREWPWKVKETASRIGKTEKAIVNKCHRLGLSKRAAKVKWMDTHIVFAPAMAERREGGAR